MSNANKARAVATRYLSRKDLDRLLRLGRGLETKWKKADVVDFLSRKHTRGFGVDDGPENLVGCLLLDFSKEKCCVVYLVVDPDYRRLGYGTVLLECAEKFAAEKDEGLPLVVVAPDGALDMHLFLKANGYKGTSKGETCLFEKSRAI